MMDRLLLSTMNLTVMVLITLTAGGSLFLGYWGLLQLFNGQTSGGGCAVFAALAPGVASLKLCQYRNDLVDR